MRSLWMWACATLLSGFALQATAVDYALPDLAGRPHPLAQYRGKWVIVNYWATWCGTCREELPELAALHRTRPTQDIVVLGINFETLDTAALQRFVAEQDIPYPVLRSAPARNTPLGPVPALPTTYIVDPSGNTVAGQVGLVSREDIECYIAEHTPSDRL